LPLTLASPSLAAKFDAWVAPPTAEVAVEFAAGRLSAGRGERVGVLELPPGAVAPSAVRPNLADPATLTASLRHLLETCAGIGAEVALLLPDLTARVSVLDFDRLPPRRDEHAALARFRLRKSLPFAEDQAVVSTQPLSSTRLLVAVADRARLDEYENCLEAAGAHAATVLPSGLACLAADPVLNHAALLIRAEQGSLTTAFCWSERLDFFRVIEVQSAASFDDIFPSVAFFRDKVEAAAITQPILYASGLGPELESRLRDEIAWATLRVAPAPAELAVAGALRGRFL
jgi:hypothetical protein